MYGAKGMGPTSLKYGKYACEYLYFKCTLAILKEDNKMGQISQTFYFLVSA